MVSPKWEPWTSVPDPQLHVLALSSSVQCMRMQNCIVSMHHAHQTLQLVAKNLKWKTSLLKDAFVRDSGTAIWMGNEGYR